MPHEGENAAQKLMDAVCSARQPVEEGQAFSLPFFQLYEHVAMVLQVLFQQAADPVFESVRQESFVGGVCYDLTTGA